MILWVIVYGCVAFISFMMMLVKWKKEPAIGWAVAYAGWMLALIEIIKHMEGI